MPVPTEKNPRDVADTLSYIRDTMATATTFTALSGWGVAGVGIVGLAAAWLAWATGQPAPLRIWVPAAVIGATVSAMGNVIKARRLDLPLWTGSFRKLAWGLVPALIAGTFLTFGLRESARALIPGMWLAVYGAGVAAGGVVSVGAIRVMGLCLIALGGAALWHPAGGTLFLALGFGMTHVLVGLYIVVRHGG